MPIDPIDLIVGSAVLLGALQLFFWLRSAALRERMEGPKHVFLAQAQAYDETVPDSIEPSTRSQHP
jgi:hypothetical protein